VVKPLEISAKASILKAEEIHPGLVSISKWRPSHGPRTSLHDLWRAQSLLLTEKLGCTLSYGVGLVWVACWECRSCKGCQS